MKIIVLIILTLVISGCGKTTTKYINIQQDGKPEIITMQDFNDEVEIKYNLNYYINNHPDIDPYQFTYEINDIFLKKKIKYLGGYLEYQYNNPPDEIKKYIDFIKSQNGYVNGEDYPYILVIPISSSAELKDHKDNEISSLDFERCTRANQVEYESKFFILKSKNPNISNNRYEYNLYINYNIAASKMLLNNIENICVSYYENSKEGSSYYSDTAYITKTNKLIIPAQEIKDALDYWNIPYDL